MCRKLDPDLALRVPWTQEEDELLLHLQEVHDNHWAEMAKSLKGRNAQMCRTRSANVLPCVPCMSQAAASQCPCVSSCLYSLGQE